MRSKMGAIVVSAAIFFGLAVVAWQVKRLAKSQERSDRDGEAPAKIDRNKAIALLTEAQTF